jgi:hypothetical protein
VPPDRSPSLKGAASRHYWSHVWGSGCEAAWDLIFARARVAEAPHGGGFRPRVAFRLIYDKGEVAISSAASDDNWRFLLSRLTMLSRLLAVDQRAAARVRGKRPRLVE